MCRVALRARATNFFSVAQKHLFFLHPASDWIDSIWQRTANSLLQG